MAQHLSKYNAKQAWECRQKLQNARYTKFLNIIQDTKANRRNQRKKRAKAFRFLQTLQTAEVGTNSLHLLKVFFATPSLVAMLVEIHLFQHIWTIISPHLVFLSVCEDTPNQVNYKRIIELFGKTIATIIDNAFILYYNSQN